MFNNPAWLEWKVYVWVILGHILEKISQGQICQVFQSGEEVSAYSANNVFLFKSNLLGRLEMEIEMELTEVDRKIQAEEQTLLVSAAGQWH